jgi:50S ribosomal subunit-associated GTPase HflX
VVDLTNPDWPGQKNEVEKVLHQLDIAQEKIVTVFNKIDLLADAEKLPAGEHSGNLYISAAERSGIDALQEEIFRRYFSDYEFCTIEVADKQQLDALGNWAIVLEKNRTADGFKAGVLCSLGKMLQFKEKHGGVIR